MGGFSNEVIAGERKLKSETLLASMFWRRGEDHP